MNHNQLITYFQNVNLKKYGWKSQKKLAVSHRKILSEEEIITLQPKLAAVLILLYIKNNTWHFILTERHEYDGNHSAEISFPGGKKENSDSNLLETAIRETHEEIGIQLIDQNASFFPLTQLYIPPSNFRVYPYVAIYNSELIFTPHPEEVKKILEINLQNFIQKSETQTATLTKQNYTFRAPAFIVEEKIVWGATAMILSEFKDILSQNMH